MKTKNLFALLPIFFATVCTITATNSKDRKIEITKKSSQFYLDSLTNTLGKNGIILKLDTVQFNGQGQLLKIYGEIHFTRACYGTFSTDNLDKIIIRKNFGGLSIEINPKGR